MGTVIGLPLAIAVFERTPELDDILREQMYSIFSMLISRFERAYLPLYEDDMSPKQWWRWRSWEDFMRKWCSREDFRIALADQLGGVNPDFVVFLKRLAGERAPS